MQKVIKIIRLIVMIIIVLIFTYLILALFVPFFLDGIFGKSMKFVNGDISVLSVAVSVWVGLNIYNVLSKSEIDNKLHLYDNQWKALNENIDTKIINLKEQQSRLLLFNRLYLIENGDAFAQHFVGKFTEVNTIVNLKQLIECENDFAKCYKTYSMNQWKDTYDLADKLNKDYSLILNDYSDDTKKARDIEFKFINLRKADALFYKNAATRRMNNEDSTFNVEEMENSISIYEEYYKSTIENSNNDELIAYFENAIGYRKMLIYDSKMEENSSTPNLSDELIGAENYITRATKHTKNGVAKYCVNLGAAYEKHANICWQDEYQNKALQCYKDATKIDKSNFKAFNDIAHIKLIKIEKALGVYTRAKTKKGSGRNYWLLCDIKPNDLFNYAQELDEVISCAKIAIGISYTFEDSHYNLAKAYMYKSLSCENEEMKKELFQKAHNQFDIVFSLNKNCTGAHFCLRNLYEAEGNIKNALEECEKECISGKGDTHDFKKIYEQELQKK